MVTTGFTGLNIVSIGGGTGLSTLLSGLKGFVGKEPHLEEEALADRIEKLTAVVTVTDDGGSSGRLREEFQILPPGDIRNCMVALAEDEHLLTRLFQYRFESDGDLSGHSFGNLFLAALAGVTGDFLEALKMTSEVLAIKGRIFPSTVEDVALVAELEDGRVLRGETAIAASRARVRRLRLSCTPCRPLPETLEALREADIITIGPGSLYTSLIPNLLVEDIVDTMRESEALKIYVCNVMTQPGETEGFSVEDHLRVLFEYSPQLKLDYVVVNSAPITPALREKYLADGSVQVEFESEPATLLDRSPQVVSSFDRKAASRFQIISGDLVNEDDVIRHDPHKLARLLLDIYATDRMTSRRSVRVR